MRVKRSVWQRRLHFAAFALAALGVAALFRLTNPTIIDPDSFHHLGFARVYAQHGPLLSSFPWIPYSVINRFSSDIWYGFHLLLIPFTFFRDPVLGIRVAAVFEIAILLVLVYVVMCRHQVRYAFLWPFMVFFLSPATLFGLLATRPQTITIGIFALLLSYLVSGGFWGAALTSLAISWLHLSFSWVIPLVVVIVTLFRAATEKTWAWKQAVAALAGMLLGWLLRPHPIGAAKIEYIQLAQLAIERHREVPLLFGRELRRLAPPEVGSFFLWFLLIWFAATLIFAIATILSRDGISPRNRALLLSSFSLSVILFVVTILETRRAIQLWNSFTVVFAAGVFTCFLDPHQSKVNQFLNQGARLLLALSMAACFAFMARDCLEQHVLYPKWEGIEAGYLKDASLWLRDHSQDDGIVYNVSWDMFSPLFFWNQKNHYVAGIDPIFLYAYDQGLYWKAHHLQKGDTVAYTCAFPQCRPETREDTYQVLRRDFKASYVVIDMQRNLGLSRYLATDRRYKQCYWDGRIAVYQMDRG